MKSMTISEKIFSISTILSVYGLIIARYAIIITQSSDKITT